LREKAKRLREETDFAVVGHMGDTSIYQLCWDLRGMEQFFMDLLINKKMAKAILEEAYRIQARKMEIYLREVGEYLDVVCVGDDLAGQTGPLTSLELYREMVLPYHSAYFSLIKSKTRAKLHLHTCGAIQEFIDALVDIGVDIINPMQVSAKGMDPAYLKKKFGNKICFWGGIDTQKLLPRGTAEDVAENVITMWNLMHENGGYVLGAVHNIQDGVPPENIAAMFDTAASIAQSCK
jgi:uroporphyrinogen decarboxylase